MYTITVTVIVPLLLLSPHRPSTLGNMIMIVLTELNNNVNRQLTLGLRKLIEKITSAFWVNLWYRLRSWLTVPLQGFEGWLTSHLFIVLQCYCEYCFTVILWVLFTVTYYLVAGSDSAPGIWAVVPGMYGTHLKHGQYLQAISFNNLGAWLTRVIGVVCDASITCGNWCSLT